MLKESKVEFKVGLFVLSAVVAFTVHQGGVEESGRRRSRKF